MTTEQQPKPTLTLDQKVSLLFGAAFWATRAVESAGIPHVVLSDGPHGVRYQANGFDHLAIEDSLPSTCFPPAVAIGSSWNPALAARIGAAIAREAQALGVHVVLGPGVNIKRSALCGRNFEYYSEDPLLSGVLGAAHARAVQEGGVGACVKHFAANNQETERMRISAEVDERTLREIYLPAFERVVKEARPATVMSAYNQVNGVPASANRWLLTEVLRDEWGFEGAVVSDWGAVNNAVASIGAGLDLSMPGPSEANVQRVLAAVRAGELSEEQIDRAVARVLGLAALVPAAKAPAFDLDAHHALARDAAAECAVLLKNSGAVLPLARGQRIAVIGEFARTPRYQGGGSSHLNPTRVDVALDALQHQAAQHDCRIDFAPGFTLDGSGDPAVLRDAAVAAAKGAELALVFLGLGEQDESEGFDRTHIDLPAAQVEALLAVAAAAPRTVVVLANGGVLSLEGWHDQVDAIVEGFLLGQGGGSAIAELLFGLRTPSGRLAETIPLRLEDSPSFLNFPGEKGKVRYGEGVMVGYRWYETLGRAVRYPFGHGLSYTSFAQEALQVEATGRDTARLTLEVSNTGRFDGQHVVQVYVATSAGPVRRPLRELRAFDKIALRPGESRVLTFELDRRAFAYYDVDAHDWIVARGDYTIQIGENASSIVLESRIALEGDLIVIPLSMDSSVGDWMNHPVIGPALLQELGADLPPGALDKFHAQPGLLKMIESMPVLKALSFLISPAVEPTLQRLIKISLDTPC